MLVGVCVLEAALVAVAVRVSTERAFRAFVVEEALGAFVADVEAAVQASGTVTAEALADAPASGQPPPGAVPPPVAVPPPGAGRPPGAGPPPGVGPTRRGELLPPPELGRSIEFGLADAEGRIVRPFDAYAAGDVLTASALEAGRAVVVDDRRVATAFVPKDAPDALAGLPPSSPEVRFVASSTAALGVALALALAVSLAVGLWLAGRTVRPLRRLTEAARGIAAGDLGRSVDIDSADEVGALAEAFNTMSEKLAGATALRQRMTADVSHDLRTPVTAVLGTLELIESGVLEPTPERIRTARVEAQRLARLIESFHTLALADAGDLPVHLVRLAPLDALRHTATAFEAQAETAGVEIVVEAEGAPDARADPDRLTQVLANLVSNALRYTPPGGRITLGARSAPDGVEVSVADTGSGISADVLPHVFERSVRADAARSGGGAGLGLSIVRSLVEAMGGAVRAVGAPGAGTTVTVTVPAWSASVDAG